MNAAASKAERRMWNEIPDWDVRSAIILEPGRWEMCNGHHALVQRAQSFDAKRREDNKPIKFTIWFGRCEECNEGRSWNSNGTYAANGKHTWDILRRAESP